MPDIPAPMIAMLGWRPVCAHGAPLVAVSWASDVVMLKLLLSGGWRHYLIPVGYRFWLCPASVGAAIFVWNEVI